jgi:hypothetical protein
MSTDGKPNFSSFCLYSHSLHRQQFHHNLSVLPFCPTSYVAAVYRLPAVTVCTPRLHLSSVFHTCSMDTFIKMCSFPQHYMTLCHYLTHFSSVFRFIILLLKPTAPVSTTPTVDIQISQQPSNSQHVITDGGSGLCQQRSRIYLSAGPHNKVHAVLC